MVSVKVETKHRCLQGSPLGSGNSCFLVLLLLVISTGRGETDLLVLCVLPACMSVHSCALLVPEEAEEGVGSLELYLHMVLSHHMGAGN